MSTNVFKPSHFQPHTVLSLKTFSTLLENTAVFLLLGNILKHVKKPTQLAMSSFI